MNRKDPLPRAATSPDSTKLPPPPNTLPVMMEFTDIQALVSEDMKAVNALIQKRLSSQVALINQLGHYIINSGGKRLRPILLLLSARAFGYEGGHHYQLAAVVEFIHTATLLHDDVVDASEMRRGKQTANSLWGNEASVLVGDFLYSRAFQMMVEVDSMKVMEILAEATNVIAEGEVLQLLNCQNPDTTEQEYLEVIRRKTAKLFEAAAQLGAVLTGQSPREEQALAAYGRHLGTAFQLIDDVLDYNADPETSGKNIGDDLAEGKPTLPLIYALQHSNSRQRELLRQAIQHGGRERIGEVVQAIHQTSALEYSMEAARREAEKAISALAQLSVSRYNDALKTLAEFSVNRAY